MKPAPGSGTVPGTTGVRWALPAALALWGLLAFVNYCAHHPIRLADVLKVTVTPLLALTWTGLLTHWLAGLKSVATLLVQLLAAWPLGVLVYDWLGLARTERGERTFFSLLLGLGIFALLVLGAGFAGFFSAATYVVLLAGSITLGVNRYVMLAKTHPRLTFNRPSWWMALGLAAVAVTQLGSLISGFAPPHISDELTYHLGNARWFLWHGKIVLQPGSAFATWSLADSMLYGAPVAFNLMYGVKWMHWVAGALTAWGLHLLLQKQRAESRWAVLLVFGTMPTVWILAGWAYSDLFLCAYGTGALLAAQRAREAKGSRSFAAAILAGACVGLAGGFKYTGLVLGLMLVPYLPWRALLVAGSTAIVVAAPGLAQNWLMLGNPVFPFFIGGLGWDAHLAWRMSKLSHWGDTSALSQLTLLPQLPWVIPIHNLGGGLVNSTGILFAMGIALLFCAARAREAFAVGAFLVPCMLGSVQGRYLLPLVPLLLTIMARGLTPLWGHHRRRALALAGLVVLLWCQTAEFFTAGWKLHDDPLPHLFGQESLSTYLDRKLYPPLYYPRTYSKMVDAVEQQTPANARILLLGGYGGAFYFSRPTYFGMMGDRPLPLTWTWQSRTPEHLRIKFKQRGVTHVLVNRKHCNTFFNTWNIWDWRSGKEVIRWRDLWYRYAVPTWKFRNHYALYRLSRRPVTQPRHLLPGIEEEESRLALFRIRKRDYATADAKLKPLLSLFPRSPPLWLRSAQSFAHQGRLDEARRCCRRVAELAPDSLDHQRCLAELAWVQGQYEEATALLAKVLEEESDDAQGWADLWGLYSRMNREDLGAAAHRQYLKYKFP